MDASSIEIASGAFYNALENYYKKFAQEAWSCNISTANDKLALIIDSRIDNRIEHVLVNFVHKLAPYGWSFMFIHFDKNADFIRTICNKFKNIQLKHLNGDLDSIDKYNKLLTSADFWRQLPSEHILIFQMDTMMCNGNIDKFLEYDYVGAPWPLDLVKSWNIKHFEKKTSEGVTGNGGLSLRYRNEMIRVCENYVCLTNEDVFFSEHCKYVCPFEKALEFSSESMLNRNACGFHAIYKFFNLSINFYRQRLGL